MLRAMAQADFASLDFFRDLYTVSSCWTASIAQVSSVTLRVGGEIRAYSNQHAIDNAIFDTTATPLYRRRVQC